MSVRWTPRARRLGNVLWWFVTIAVVLVLLIMAFNYGQIKQCRWDRSHGLTQERC